MADSRNEAILENILGADNPTPDPMSPNEALLLEISEELEKQPGEPISSEEIDEIIAEIS